MESEAKKKNNYNSQHQARESFGPTNNFKDLEETTVKKEKNPMMAKIGHKMEEAVLRRLLNTQETYIKELE